MTQRVELDRRVAMVSKHEKDEGLVLSNMAAIVTGAGSGVGKAMAKLFAKKGCSVLAVDVVPERLNGLAEDLKAEGAKVSVLAMDLTVHNEPERMVAHAMAEFGRLDILCNNAGIMDGAKPAAETTDDLWHRVMAVNLEAPFRASRSAIPIMLSQGGGTIINTASVAGLFGGMAGAAYTTSKHALIGLTRSIAAHYGARGIRCNAMVLGGVNTNIGIGGLEPDKEGLQHVMKSASMIPRVAEPSEIAELALFLASSKSSYINGSCIVIDGGWTVF
jgi:NAD(P)-dependent dehydrogenase (short-subunit alcohol dehydrogenase family)